MYKEVRDMVCGKCGFEDQDSGNFCRRCGSKLRRVCDCYIKKEPYNCGQDPCPGYRLFLQEANQAKAQAASLQSHSQNQE